MRRSKAKQVRREQFAERVPERPPRRAMDWKGLAVLIPALVGAAGFVWNKAEGCADRLRANAVQAASYQTLAEGIDDMAKRVAALEQAVVALPTLFQKKQAEAEKLVAPVKQPAAPVMIPLGAADFARARVALTPPDELFQKMSGLPSFDEVKQAAEPKN